MAAQMTETVQFGAFLDVQQDVKPWLQLESTDTSNDSNLELLTDMACTWVQEYLGRPIGPTQYQWRFDGWSGWNGAYIMLPRTPVLEIVTVTEWWGDSVGQVLTESTPENQTDGFQVTPETGRLTRVFPGNVPRPWFPGSRNIEITWIAGLNPVPSTLKVAALELTAHWFHNTRQNEALSVAARPSTEEDTSAGLWQGVPYRVVDLIEPHIQVGIG